MKTKLLISATSLALLASCATHEQVTVEKKKNLMVVHHRSIHGTKAVDHIETISSKGVLTQATIEVYDVGRLPDGRGGMTEAHRYYRIAQRPAFDLRLPKKSGTTGTGVETVYTPPNYVPLPKDQRINDQLEDLQRTKQKLDAEASQVENRLKEDNALRGELQTQQDENQVLRDKINALFAPKTSVPSQTPSSDAAKEAAGDVNQLTNWATQQQ
ncbi:MAG: hypothetical protein JO232_24205 [Verrucomicrobia bacterium]|nr:hypothetical protein [Verrucomicrobiota bacterium]